MTLPDGANAGDHDDKVPDAANHVSAGAENVKGETASEHAAAGSEDTGEEDTGGESGASGTAIEPAHASAVARTGHEAGIEPFLAAAAGERIDPPRADRSFAAKLLDYSAHAAMIAGLLGFAYTLSAHTGKSREAAVVTKPVVVTAAMAVPVPSATEELRLATQKMAAEIGTLRSSLDAMRSGLHGDGQRQDKALEQIRSLSANLEGVKAQLAASKTETTAALTALSSKLDHMPHADASGKLQQVSDRLDKLEHENADPVVTASLPPQARTAPVAVPPVKPKLEAADAGKKPGAAEADAAKKPQIIPEWVVREVDDGVAIVESKRGQLAVEPGVTIPGAGVVKSIDRHGGTWTVTTTKGLLAYAPMREDGPPARDYPRIYYRGPHDDY